MKPAVQADKVVVLSGSGLSAESGLPTFRDSQGLWNQYTWQEVASPEGWRERPDAVLAFYNERRRKAWAAQPNDAHRAIAELERAFEVVVITQNVDALHERAGSSRVLHVHGELAYARGTGRDARRYRIDDAPIALGQLAEDGSQLRPDIVWFGEQTRHMEEARRKWRGTGWNHARRKRGSARDDVLESRTLPGLSLTRAWHDADLLGLCMAVTTGTAHFSNTV